MRPPPFVEHCQELLAPLGAVRVRAMFGGWGLYLDGFFVALIAFERLYLKADASTREQFTAAGCQPFVYDGQGKSVTMGYWTAPDEALDSPMTMQPWARLALQAAVAARARSTTRLKPRAPPIAPPIALPSAAKTARTRSKRGDR